MADKDHKLNDNDDDWTKDVDYSPEKLQKLKGDINLLLARLETAPATLNDLSEYTRTGNVFMTKSGKLKWKQYSLRLTGDQLTFSTAASPDPSYQCELCYAHLMTVEKEDAMTQLQQRMNIKASKKRLNIITFGAVVTLTFDSDQDANDWWAIVKKVLRAKFKRDELVQKEEARQALDPLVKEQENILWAKHEAIIKALAASGFWSSKEKKLHEGYLYEVRRKRKSKKYYTVLFRDYLYFFKPHEKVSASEKPADMVALRFVSSVDYVKDSKTSFYITTPLRKIILEGKHEVAVGDWLKSIGEQCSKKEGVEGPVSLPADGTSKKVSDKGYVYNKNILGKMSITENYTGKEKSYKLKKQDTNTIGRSSSSDVRMDADRFISRQHCKIVVENNVPYVVDLGQSKDGTLLNGKKITKCALKPGDVIRLGDTDCTFSVKDATAIFLQTRAADDNSSEEESSEKKKKKKKKPSSKKGKSSGKSDNAVQLEKDD